MSSTDAIACTELREALHIWELAKGIEQASIETWNDELTLLRRDLFLGEDICIDNHPSLIR